MKKTLMLKIFLVIGLVAFMISCGQPEWLVVTGTGAPAKDKPAAQGKLLAKRAAEMDARRALLEQIKGVKIDSRTYVKDYLTQNDSIRSEIDGLVKGAQILTTRFNDDGTVEVDIRIDLKKVKKLIK